jgi:hypothetical protein
VQFELFDFVSFQLCIPYKWINYYYIPVQFDM